MNKQNQKYVLKDFYLLWSTQGLSALGSSMTAFALTLWLYEKTGSSLGTAALTICTYLPYVLMSIFAGALCDKLDKKKTMLVCDTLAAVGTVVVYLLFKLDMLQVWHLYAINVLEGLMNTVQQPASEVAMTLVIPKEHYQKTSGLRNLSRSVVSILHPVLATALYGVAGLDLVIAFDLVTFGVAFFSLLLGIKLPKIEAASQDNVIKLAKEGIRFLKDTPMVLCLILFMAGVNLVASGFDAALPGYVIPNPKGGTGMLGIVSSCSGLAMVFGSILVSVMPKPKNRVRVIFWTMLISLGTENFILAFSRQPILWCLGQIIGWILVPIMSTNLEVILRNTIPLELQGRVYACRNTLQFFTIPIGLFLGGLLVDQVCEPFMAKQAAQSIWCQLFGFGKGSGAALLIFMLGVAGILLCCVTGQRLQKYSYEEESEQSIA